MLLLLCFFVVTFYYEIGSHLFSLSIGSIMIWLFSSVLERSLIAVAELGLRESWSTVAGAASAMRGLLFFCLLVGVSDLDEFDLLRFLLAGLIC